MCRVGRRKASVQYRVPQYLNYLVMPKVHHWLGLRYVFPKKTCQIIFLNFGDGVPTLQNISLQYLKIFCQICELTSFLKIHKLAFFNTVPYREVYLYISFGK